ncbi:MAG TPA: GNAT family N-acetyltransferase [Angustibacter sp.]|nr:GNAT family N-acetyltransferase [Angustibacter sp.]
MTTRETAYTTKPLTAGTWDDFARLVEANNGVWGGCWCMGFHPEGFSRADAPGGNREAKRDHVRRGSVHQTLVYDGDDCVGWCQYGSPAELPNIKNPAAYAKGLAEPPDWRIGCIFTGSRHRGHGVARAAVAATLEAIRAAGGGVVEAYPEQVEGRPPQRGAYFHTGPESLFTELGFVRDRRIAKWRWVMRREVS